MLSFEIPDLHSAITLFINNQNCGAHHHRDDYQRHHLPPSFEILDVWTHMHFARSPLNEFYPEELRILRCKSLSKAGRITFDPILVEVISQRGVSRKLFVMARLFNIHSFHRGSCCRFTPHLQVGQSGGSECVCICALVLARKTGAPTSQTARGLEDDAGEASCWWGDRFREYSRPMPLVVQT